MLRLFLTLVLTLPMFGQVNAPDKIKATLLKYVRENEQFREECRLNLDNQFTPGYRSYQIFSRLKDGRSRLNQEQGKIVAADSATNLAVSGSGFFIVQRPGSNVGYTRDGRFHFRNDTLCSEDNYPLLGLALNADGKPSQNALVPIQLVYDRSTKRYGGRYVSFGFDESGRMFGKEEEQDQISGQLARSYVPLFQIQLATFENPENLRRTSDVTIMEATPESGPSVPENSPHINPQHLELSNVDFQEQAYLLAVLRQYAELLP